MSLTYASHLTTVLTCTFISRIYSHLTFNIEENL